MIWITLLILSLLSGYLLLKVGKHKLVRTMVWLIPLVNVSLGYYAVRQDGAGFRMLVLILLLFLGMKNVILVYRYQGRGRLTLLQWFCFALGWPGMDPLPFEQAGKIGKLNRAYLLSGFSSCIAGGTLLCLLAWLLHDTALPAYLLSLLAFVPFVLLFHMGIFNMLAGVWQYFGVNTGLLMDAPWKSESLGAFWGKRWNIAFIQMTRICLFIPLARKGRTVLALALSFFISGIFHEVALTLPAGGNYGWPLLYFLLQFIFVRIEKQYSGTWSRPAKKLYLWLALLLPFPLLFPPAFLSRVMLPFLQMI